MRLNYPSIFSAWQATVSVSFANCSKRRTLLKQSTKEKHHATQSLSFLQRAVRGRVQVLRRASWRQDRCHDDTRRHTGGEPGAAGVARKDHPCAHGHWRSVSHGVRRTPRSLSTTARLLGESDCG